MKFAEFQKAAMETCVFCKPSPELIVDESEHFILMLDPFPLIPCHLLMTSKIHYGCLGEVPIELHTAAEQLRELAYLRLRNALNAPITRYEHGRSGHCLMRDASSRSCHHYHEHLIPKNLSLHHNLASRFKYIAYQQEETICDLFGRYNEYLLVAEPNEAKRLYIAKHCQIEPHLLRTLSAKVLGYPERQNWENYASCDLMLEGKERLDLTYTKARPLTCR